MIHTFLTYFSRTVALMLHCCVHRLSSVCRLYGMYCGWTGRPRTKVTIDSL